MQNGARGKRTNALREASREVNKGEIDSEARRGGGFVISHDHVLATGRSTERAHDDVTHSGGPGLTGSPTPIADPSAHSSEATTGGSRAGDSFDRREQRAGGLIHRVARVLVRDMAHETRDGGKASARTLAAPVVTRALHGHSGSNLIDPTLQDNVLIGPGIFLIKIQKILIILYRVVLDMCKTRGKGIRLRYSG